MSDTNLVDALQGLLHFLFHTYIGVRLLGLAVVIGVVILIAKQSFQIAKFLGGTLLAGGLIVILGGVWGFLTSTNFGYIGYALLGFVAVMAGRGILDSYGTAPLQAPTLPAVAPAPPQAPLPAAPKPISPYPEQRLAS